MIGLAIGTSSSVLPVYLSEIAPVEVRGRVVALYILMTCIAYVISGITAFSLGNQWRIMIGIAAVPAFMQGAFMLYMPETQRWLAKKGKTVKTQKVLAQVYNP